MGEVGRGGYDHLYSQVGEGSYMGAVEASWRWGGADVGALWELVVYANRNDGEHAKTCW